MDYTPISTRRVLVAFAFTAFVALVPAFYLFLQRGSDGPLTVFANADGSSRDLLLVLGSVALTAGMIGALVLLMSIGRRLVRRPARA